MGKTVEESTMTLESARPLLKTLAKVSADLNEASDRYTEELKTIEAELEKMNIGIEVWLDHALKETDWEEEEKETPQGDEYVKEYFHAWYLGYGKHQGQWRLLLYQYRQTPKPGWAKEAGMYEDTLVDKAPLLDSSRDLRVASADHITDLLAKIGEEAKHKTEALRKVSDTR